MTDKEENADEVVSQLEGLAEIELAPEFESELESFLSDNEEPSSSDSDTSFDNLFARQAELRGWYEVSKPSFLIRHLGKLIGVFFLLTLVGVYIAGAVNRGELSLPYQEQKLQLEPDIDEIDFRNDKVLFLNTVGQLSSVIVQFTPDGHWLLISQDDMTVTNPALSPLADRVAYLSAQDGGQVVLVSLEDGVRGIINATQVRSIAMEEKIPNVYPCEWTPVAWSPDGQQVAFFGCRETAPRSLAFVAEWDGASDKPDLHVVPGSSVDYAGARQVQWAGPDKIVVSQLSTDGNQVETLDVK